MDVEEDDKDEAYREEDNQLIMEVEEGIYLMGNIMNRKATLWDTSVSLISLKAKSWVRDQDPENHISKMYVRQRTAVPIQRRKGKPPRERNGNLIKA